MSRRCQIKGCKKQVKYKYEGKYVCRYHVCRCGDWNAEKSDASGCLIHKKKAKKTDKKWWGK